MDKGSFPVVCAIALNYALGSSPRLSSLLRENFNSAEEYFNYLLKKDEVFDITPLRKRFGSLSTYYAIALELRKNLEIIEYQPDNFISYKKNHRQRII